MEPTSRPRRWTPATLLLLAALLAAGCGAAPAGAPNVGAPGGGGSGGAAATLQAATARPSSAYPDHFAGTIEGANGVDSWSGTATLDRLPDTDECTDGGANVCYAIAGGSVVWTVEGVSKTIPLGPSTAADGIVLIVADLSHAERNGTYEISVAPTTDISIDLPNGPRSAFDNVRAWVNVVDFPRFGSDWHLKGTYADSGCGIDGCGAGQSWSWDLQGTFGP